MRMRLNRFLKLIRFILSTLFFWGDKKKPDLLVRAEKNFDLVSLET